MTEPDASRNEGPLPPGLGDPRPQTAPDGSTVIGPPDPPGGEQNTGYEESQETTVPETSETVG